ncbi:hypothetical protein PRIEUP_LOCUS1239, partial [Pristimantis euphronides]
MSKSYATSSILINSRNHNDTIFLYISTFHSFLIHMSSSDLSTNVAASTGSAIISRSQITTISRPRDTQGPGMSTGWSLSSVSSTELKVRLNTQSGATASPSRGDTTGSSNGMSNNPSVSLRSSPRVSGLSGSRKTTRSLVSKEIKSSNGAFTNPSENVPGSVKTRGTSSNVVSLTSSSVSLKSLSVSSVSSVLEKTTKFSNGMSSTDPTGRLNTQSRTNPSSVLEETKGTSNETFTNPSVSLETPSGVSGPPVPAETTGSSSRISINPSRLPGTGKTTGSSVSGETTRFVSSVSTNPHVSLNTPFGASGAAVPEDTTKSSSNSMSSTGLSVGLATLTRTQRPPGPGETTQSSSVVSSNNPIMRLSTQSRASAFSAPVETTSSSNVVSTDPNVSLKPPSVASGDPGSGTTTESSVSGETTKSLSNMSTKPSVNLEIPTIASSLLGSGKTTRSSVSGEVTGPSNGAFTSPSENLPGSGNTTGMSSNVVSSTSSSVSLKTLSGVAGLPGTGNTTKSYSNAFSSIGVSFNTSRSIESGEVTGSSSNVVSSTSPSVSLKSASRASDSSRRQETTGSSSNGFLTSRSVSFTTSLGESSAPESGKTIAYSSNDASSSSPKIIMKTTVPSQSGQTSRISSNGIFSTSPGERLQTISGESSSPQPEEITNSVSSIGPDSSVSLKTPTGTSGSQGSRMTTKSSTNGYSTLEINGMLTTNYITTGTKEIITATVKNKPRTLITSLLTGTSVTNSESNTDIAELPTNQAPHGGPAPTWSRGVTHTTAGHGGGQTQVGTTVSPMDNSKVPATTTTGGGLVTEDKSKTTSVTTTTTSTTSTTTTTSTTSPAAAAEAAGSIATPFPVYGRVILGLLAAALVVGPVVACLV